MRESWADFESLTIGCYGNNAKQRKANRYKSKFIVNLQLIVFMSIETVAKPYKMCKVSEYCEYLFLVIFH